MNCFTFFTLRSAGRMLMCLPKIVRTRLWTRTSNTDSFFGMAAGEGKREREFIHKFYALNRSLHHSLINTLFSCNTRSVSLVSMAKMPVFPIKLLHRLRTTVTLAPL